jgi:ATP-dependent RNA helicase DDX46/PRP5
VLKAGLPAKPAFSLPPATLARIGLPIKSNLPNKPTSGLIMDDSDASDRKLQKLNLPPVDPLVAPGGLAPDEMVSENLDVVSDDEDGDDAMEGLAAAAIKSNDKMEVDGEDEEEDPLDAFMKGNTEEVKKVNKEDEAKFGGPVTSGPRSEVLNEDDDIGDDDEPQRDGPMTAEDILALAAKKAKKKDLPVAQHGKITYEPFRKKFYVPNQETNDMDEEDVELMRVEMDGIKIRGADCPRPVRNWGAFGLPAGCYDVIKRLGYTAPTSIQAQAIPAIMSGRDIIGVAKTGSGKTIAFLLPLFRHIKDQRPLETGEGPMALIMTPTRELATQIWRESKPFLMALGMRAVCAYGGAPLSEQIGDMKKGTEVVVCTPGRMIDLLTANSGRVTNLRRCTYLVLDEADRMFDMGFEPQVSIGRLIPACVSELTLSLILQVMKIVNNIRPDRQTLLFSATFPAKMDALARKILIKPLEITVGGRSVVAKEITQQVEIRDADQKFLRLLEILGEMGEKHKDEEDFRTLIFVERQESADELFRELMRKGYICTSLHGGKDQVDRDQAIADFKLGYIPIVIATSVAARGLDVKELKLVINYDCPNHMEDYVHRAGRTGRAGNSGTCVTFVQSDQERYAVDIVRALKASEATVPPELEKMSEGEFRPCKPFRPLGHPTDSNPYLRFRFPGQSARRKGQGRWIRVRWEGSG